jgi:hypothetical protein
MELLRYARNYELINHLPVLLDQDTAFPNYTTERYSIREYHIRVSLISRYDVSSLKPREETLDFEFVIG